MRPSSAVSTSCASAAGAVTRTIGSWSKTTSPSSTAHTSPVNRNAGRYVSKNDDGTSARAPSVRSHAISSAVKCRVVRYSSACSRPAATRYCRWSGNPRTNSSKVRAWSWPDAW